MAVTSTAEPVAARSLHIPAAAVGAFIWVVAIVIVRPPPHERIWAEAILALAALVLVPLGLGLLQRGAQLLALARVVQLPAAILLGYGLLLKPGVSAALLALPWFVLTLVLAAAGALRVLRGPRDIATLCENAALIFVSVGGGWTLLDRAGIRPLDFEPVIVLLTGIHFHYAGFVLPLLTGQVLRRHNTSVARAAALGVIYGVPLVGVGITTSQLGLTKIFESLAAWILSLAAITIGLLHIRLARRAESPQVVRILWAIAGLALTASMVLAALYGTRFYLPIAWLDIPWMRALHGTANSLGFALGGLIAWTVSSIECPRRLADEAARGRYSDEARGEDTGNSQWHPKEPPGIDPHHE